MLVRLVGDIAEKVARASIEAWVTVKKSPLGVRPIFLVRRPEIMSEVLMETAAGVMPRTYSGDPTRNRV